MEFARRLPPDLEPQLRTTRLLHIVEASNAVRVAKVRQIVGAAFSLPGIRWIMATTHPDHAASIRVLEKNGFRRAGRGFEKGTIAFLLEKKEHPPGSDPPGNPLGFHK